MDDPLSAVDVNVGKHLYNQCIRGFLKDKAVVLVTHQLQYLKDADNILLLKKGTIEAQGTFQKLMAIGSDLSEFLVDDENENEETVQQKQFLCR